MFRNAPLFLARTSLGQRPRRASKSSWLLATALTCLAASPSLAQDCQALAEHPDRGGVEQYAIDGPAATKACLSELRKDPFSAKLMGLAARALRADGKPQEAFGYASKAALLGDAVAMNTLALLYLEGGASSPASLPDPFLARIWFEKAGLAGLGDGFLNLADLYREGKGITASKEKAADYVARAIELGSGKAQNQVSNPGSKGDPDQQLAVLESLANKYHAPSMMKLGKAYYFGEMGLPVDFDRAVDLLRGAVDQYYEPAYYYLGLAYEEGNGVPQDTEKAAYFYERGHRADIPLATLALGQFYRDGKGVTRDDDKAFELLKRAADAGLAAGLTDFGYMYYDGKGVERDRLHAVDLFEQGDAKGDALASAQLGYMYEQGVAVEADLPRARDYYERGAERSNTYSRVQLGFMLRDGIGGPEDLNRSFKLFMQAAQTGHDDALAAVAFAYERGMGVEQNMATALDWYQRAADADSGWGTFNLAWLLIYGEKEFYDLGRGLRTMHQAADLNYARAFTELGYIYSEGTGGTPIDHEQAVKWFEKAIDAGRSDALNGLALQYDFGWGVTRDHAKAVSLYEQAVAKGDTQAMTNLGFAYHAGLGVEQDDKKAADLYQQVLDAGDSSNVALTNLAWAYEHGQGVGQDYDKARELYRRAQDNGSKQAAFALARWQHYGIAQTKDLAAATQSYEAVADYSHAVALELARITLDAEQQLQRYEALAQQTIDENDFSRLSTFANRLGDQECELGMFMASQIAKSELGYLKKVRGLVEQAVENGYTAAAFLLGDSGGFGDWESYQQAYDLGCPPLTLEAD